MSPEYSFLLDQQSHAWEIAQDEQAEEYEFFRSQFDQGHLDCLECSPPPEFLEDTPQ